MSYGADVVSKAIEMKLAELFPTVTHIDFNLVAKDLIEAADVAAVGTINQRERQLQDALQGLMAYYSHLIQSNHDRIRELEQRVADLNRKLCAQVAIPSSAGGPGDS